VGLTRQVIVVIVIIIVVVTGSLTGSRRFLIVVVVVLFIPVRVASRFRSFADASFRFTRTTAPPPTPTTTPHRAIFVIAFRAILAFRPRVRRIFFTELAVRRFLPALGRFAGRRGLVARLFTSLTTDLIAPTSTATAPATTRTVALLTLGSRLLDVLL
jgi:hypothetical protein